MNIEEELGMTPDQIHERQAKLADCEAQLMADPGNTALRYEAAYLLYQLGSYSEALARFEALCRHDPEDYESLGCMGKTLAALERSEEAVCCFQQAIAVWGKEPDLFADLGDALLKLGRIEEARNAYLSGLEYALPGEEAAYRIEVGLDKVTTTTER